MLDKLTILYLKITINISDLKPEVLAKFKNTAPVRSIFELTALLAGRGSLKANWAMNSDFVVGGN